jgi:hypothetical protein
VNHARSSAVAFASGFVSVVLLAWFWHLTGLAGPTTESGYPVSGYFLACVSFGFATAFLFAAFGLGWSLKHAFGTALGMLAPLPLGTIYEIGMDATSHNLIPFEIVLYWLPAFALAFGGATIGARMRREPNSSPRPIPGGGAGSTLDT